MFETKEKEKHIPYIIHHLQKSNQNPKKEKKKKT